MQNPQDCYYRGSLVGGAVSTAAGISSYGMMSLIGDDTSGANCLVWPQVPAQLSAAAVGLAAPH